MNNTTPPEIKKWINGYADAHDFLRSDINEIIVKALTSLYQHLQENGRVAELEKEVEKWKSEYNKLYRRFLDSLPMEDY